ncbi:MAG TPA: ATP-binding protein [Bacteroidales bacterium]|nr:ATP-binding protein [Bacteroidales bacterium]
MKDLSLHILDIMQNSLVAGAKEIGVEITENKDADTYSISVKDDGKGMSPEMARQVTDPFFTTRTTRKVGLGIPLLKENAERTGGSFDIISAEGVGTTINACFKLRHVDRQPLGDIAGVIVLTAASYPAVRFRYTHTTRFGTYTFDTKEVAEILGETPINDAQIIHFLKEMIVENLESINYTP